MTMDKTFFQLFVVTELIFLADFQNVGKNVVVGISISPTISYTFRRTYFGPLVSHTFQKELEVHPKIDSGHLFC